MVVMLVGALACSSLFVFSTRNNIGGGERALAMAVAQQQLEQIRSVSYEDTALDVGTATSTVQSGERNYTVAKNRSPGNGNERRQPQAVEKITITVTPQAGGRSQWSHTPLCSSRFRSTLTIGNYAVAN